MANPQPLLEQVTQNPLLVSANSQQLFQASILHVLAHEHAAEMLGSISAASEDDNFWPTDPDSWQARVRPYNVDVTGTLQIPVMGVLLNRFPYQLGRWATGYKYLEMARKRGLVDPMVKRIAYIHDSPGGEAAGCFEEVDAIYASRGQKPMQSFIADHGYSASFALATAPGDISITRSGGAGSVGVVTAHVEFSEALKDWGVKVTFIFAGAHKVDGNPYEKLPESVKSRIQERIDKIYGVFVSTVARNRGMDEKAVRDTQALTYDAQESIDIGFADRLGALEDEMALFAVGDAEPTEDENMATEKPTVEDTVAKATNDTAVAEATKAGAVGEKSRIKAILASDEGKARPKAAMSCAMNTDMSLDQAKAFLSDLPEEKADAVTTTTTTAITATATEATGKTPFDAAMEHDNPEVGANDHGNDNADSDTKASASILADYVGQTGRKTKVA
jgi:ClpP class serine protease